MLLFLVRHGDFDLGSSSLNEKGREQSAILADKINLQIQSEKIEVFSSDGPRSIQTAQIIASKLNISSMTSSLYGGKTEQVIIENCKKAAHQIKLSKANIIIVSRGKFLKTLAENLLPEQKIYKPRKGSMLIFS